MGWAPAGVNPTPASAYDLTAWVYDSASGLLLAKRDAAMNETRYDYYSGTSLVARRTWARTSNGQPSIAHYHYDDSGRVRKVSYSDGVTPEVTFGYKRDGNLAWTKDAAGLHTYLEESVSTGTAQRESITEAPGSLNLLAGLQVATPIDAYGRRAGFSASWNWEGGGLQLPLAKWQYHSANGYLSSIMSGSLNIGINQEIYGIHNTTVTRSDSSAGIPALVSSTQKDILKVQSASHFRTGFNQYRNFADYEQSLTDPEQGANGLTSVTSSWKYTFDNRGQVKSATKWYANSQVLEMKVEYDYDNIGNRILSKQGGADVTTYTRNDRNQYTSILRPDMVNITGTAPAGQTVLVNGEAAQRIGNFYLKRLESDRTDDTVPAWLPVNVSTERATPPAASQRTGHVYLPPMAETLEYDDDGSLVQDGRWEYAWDGENRLIQMTTRDSARTAGVPGLRLSFAYDAQSRRISKKVEKWETGVWVLSSEVRFIYDGWNLMAEVELNSHAADAPLAGGGQRFVRRSYVWGPDISGSLQGAGGVGGLLAVTRHERGAQASESYWATWDLNGNVIGLLSTSKADKVAVYDYDPFGKLVRVNEPEAGLNPIRFSSKYTDTETGLVYYGYRYYSPEMGRWISRDPIEEEGGINLYGMVANDPVNNWDYLGLENGQFAYAKYVRLYKSMGKIAAFFNHNPGMHKGHAYIQGHFNCSDSSFLNGALEIKPKFDDDIQLSFIGKSKITVKDAEGKNMVRTRVKIVASRAPSFGRDFLEGGVGSMGTHLVGEAAAAGIAGQLASKKEALVTGSIAFVVAGLDNAIFSGNDTASYTVDITFKCKCISRAEADSLRVPLGPIVEWSEDNVTTGAANGNALRWIVGQEIW